MKQMKQRVYVSAAADFNRSKGVVRRGCAGVNGMTWLDWRAAMDQEAQVPRTNGRWPE